MSAVSALSEHVSQCCGTGAPFCSRAPGLCSQPRQLACWDVTSQTKSCCCFMNGEFFKSSGFRGWEFSPGTFSRVLGHLGSILRSLKYSRIARVLLLVLHRSRISTPGIYSLRLTARPCKEKKCVFTETCFAIDYIMQPELKSSCCAGIFIPGKTLLFSRGEL